MFACAEKTLAAIWRDLGGEATWPELVQFSGPGDLPSVFAVGDLAGACVAAAALALAELTHAQTGARPAISVDRRLASFWFGRSLRPHGWSMVPAWDVLAGDYRTEDGWIKLHTNAPHHRTAALAVLNAAAERDAVTRAVGTWSADALEAAIVERGGCAAAMRSMRDWAGHPQGLAVAAEPLLHREPGARISIAHEPPPRQRPLANLRVLDLTRVLAGPVATRFLAGYGAEVLRIDPPGWEEAGVVPDVVLGKRCARLDLRRPDARETLEALLRRADVLVHGYRPGALDAMGFGAERRRSLCPGLIDVSLDAYGWMGPWRGRRGFDSLVQMSSGIADAGMRRLGRDRPTPLPVQALDHATGYLMAAAVIRALTIRLRTDHGGLARVSLARTAALLTGLPHPGGPAFAPEDNSADWAEPLERTAWGPARRLLAPCRIEEAPMVWDRPALDLGSAAAAWLT